MTPNQIRAALLDEHKSLSEIEGEAIQCAVNTFNAHFGDNRYNAVHVLSGVKKMIAAYKMQKHILENEQ